MSFENVDRRQTDDGRTDTFFNYKVTFGSGELKKHNLCKGLCPKFVCQVSASSQMLSEKIFFLKFTFCVAPAINEGLDGGPKNR